MKTYFVDSTGYHDIGIRTKREAQAALRAEVRESAKACRARYKHCSVIKHSPDSYTLRIGGRQGYHVWEHISISCE